MVSVLLLVSFVGLGMWLQRKKAADGPTPRSRVAVSAELHEGLVRVRFELRSDGPMDDFSIQGARLKDLAIFAPDGTQLTPRKEQFQPSISGGTIWTTLEPAPQGTHSARLDGKISIQDSNGQPIEQLPVQANVSW